MIIKVDNYMNIWACRANRKNLMVNTQRAQRARNLNLI